MKKMTMSRSSVCIGSGGNRTRVDDDGLGGYPMVHRKMQSGCTALALTIQLIHSLFYSVFYYSLFYLFSILFSFAPFIANCIHLTHPALLNFHDATGDKGSEPHVQ